MSKRELKKYIDSASTGELRNMILEAYSSRKEIKEYFDFFINPDSEKLAEKYRKKIRSEFVSRVGRLRRYPRRSVCKKAIADFRRFSPDPVVVAEVMLYYINMSELWMNRMPRSLTSGISTSVAKTFAETVDLLQKEGLMERFGKDINRIIDTATVWGDEVMQSELLTLWQEAQSRSMSSFFSGSIQAQEDEEQDCETP